MRKISVTLAVMSVLAPLGAGALGIGDIRLRSSLNQTLSAEIPLVTSGSESIDDVKVSLASPDAFNKAGVERSHALSRLRFTPVQRPDGSYVIKVSSQDPIREPFLNFLVEVNWPQGRMLREFTVLLDPPATFKEETIPATSLPETAAERRASRAVADEDYLPRREARPTRAESTAPAQRARIRGASYGPVRPNETLSGIARLVSRELGVSQDQAMAALYQANPQAFIRNNIHGLRAGETLTIPDRDTILSIPSRAKVPPPPARGTLEAQRPATSQETAEVPVQGGQLKLLSPSEEKAKQGAGREEGGKSKGDIALEVADTVKQENEEIRARLSELEQQLSGMQRLLTLKDEQLSALQGQQKPGELKPVPTLPPAPPPAAVVTTQPAPAASPEVATATTPVPAPPPAQEAVTKAPALPAATPPAKPAVKPPQPTEEPSLLGELLDEPLLLGLAGVTAALAFGIVAWAAARRRTAMMDEAESILAPSLRDRIVETPTPQPILDGMPTEHIVVSAKSSFLSEFTPSDFDALSGEADEVDPISEADVYLAYGRYKQAEELITGAIAQHPERDECKLKLLEIHYATENRAAFEKYAKELFEAGKDADPSFWEKVVEMGRELCPGNPLFTTVGDVKLDADESAYLGGEILDDRSGAQIEDDFIAELKRFEEGQRAGEGAQGSHLASFDFEEEIEQAQGDKSAPHDEQDIFASLDFDFAPSVAAKTGPATEQTQELELDNLISFEPGLKSASPQTGPDKSLDDILAEMEAKSEQGDDHVLDFDTGLDFPAGAAQPEKPAAATATSGGADAGEEDLYASLTDMDEQETKLDLAKAYIDMGDDTTAREIIDDVLARGNEAQKKEATALLTKMERS